MTFAACSREQVAQFVARPSGFATVDPIRYCLFRHAVDELANFGRGDRFGEQVDFRHISKRADMAGVRCCRNSLAPRSRLLVLSVD